MPTRTPPTVQVERTLSPAPPRGHEPAVALNDHHEPSAAAETGLNVGRRSRPQRPCSQWSRSQRARLGLRSPQSMPSSAIASGCAPQSACKLQPAPAVAAHRRKWKAGRLNCTSVRATAAAELGIAGGRMKEVKKATMSWRRDVVQPTGATTGPTTMTSRDDNGIAPWVREQPTERTVVAIHPGVPSAMAPRKKAVRGALLSSRPPRSAHPPHKHPPQGEGEPYK